MPRAIRREYDVKLYKKCIKCRTWKPRHDIEDDDGNVVEKSGFGQHDGNPDGKQVICMACKNVANVDARKRNVTARVRHHTATRCLAQLGEHAPAKLTENLEKHLGYTITTLVRALGKDLKKREGGQRKLKDALNEGYHIDHIKPLSSFQVLVTSDGATVVDWEVFQECWAVDNLRAIPAQENLQKGAKFDAS